VERVSSDTSYNVLSNTFENLGSRDEERINLLHSFSSFTNFLQCSFSDRIGFTSCTRFITSDVVTREVDTVDGNDLSGFEDEDVSDEDIVD
jgi:hypothetical protein